MCWGISDIWVALGGLTHTPLLTLSHLGEDGEASRRVYVRLRAHRQSLFVQRAHQLPPFESRRCLVQVPHVHSATAAAPLQFLSSWVGVGVSSTSKARELTGWTRRDRSSGTSELKPPTSRSSNRLPAACEGLAVLEVGSAWPTGTRCSDAVSLTGDGDAGMTQRALVLVLLVQKLLQQAGCTIGKMPPKAATPVEEKADDSEHLDDFYRVSIEGIPTAVPLMLVAR